MTTASEANAAKAHCAHGHEFTPENTYINNAGHRVCRACRRNNQRRYSGNPPPKVCARDGCTTDALPRRAVCADHTDCSYPDCGRPVAIKALCKSHANQLQRGEDLHPLKRPSPPACTVCGEKHYARGFCRRHYSAHQQATNPRAPRTYKPKPKAAPKPKPKAAPKPKPAEPEPEPWIPGTLWRELEKAQARPRPGGGAAYVDGSRLIPATVTVMPDELKAAMRAALAQCNELDLADMLGVEEEAV